MAYRFSTLGIVFCVSFALNNGFAQFSSQSLGSYMDYAEGCVESKMYANNGNEIVFLYVNKPSSVEEADSLVDNILVTDADVVCLSMPLAESDTPFLYQELKNSYAHFYQANPFFFTTQGSQGNLLVASKYSLKDFMFTAVDAEAKEASDVGFFDFVIGNNEGDFGRVYIPASQKSKHLAMVMHKIESDNSGNFSEVVTLFSPEQTSSIENSNVGRTSFSFDETKNWFLTRFKPKISCHEGFSGSYAYSIHDIICKNDSEDKDRSRTEYDFSARRDTEGTTFFRGDVGYTWSTDSGANFSVDVGGRGSYNDRDGVSGDIGVGFSGNF